jgi:cell pole-organizing protein PopZ
MTRLEASNEPSMEDILASIRKIIAEDPPGSRPVPPHSAPRAAAAAAPAPSSYGRAPTRGEALTRGEVISREPQFSSELLSAPADSNPEPYLRATPAKPETPSFGSAPFFLPKGEAKPVAARIEPSFSAMAAPVSALSPLPTVLAEPTPVALSVEAQLSDLLGDVALSPVAQIAAQTVEPVAYAMPSTSVVIEAAKPSIDFAAKLIGRPSPTPEIVAVQAETRPGFSVSRDGFMPENPHGSVETDLGAEGAAGGGDVGGRDPFDFDLGPSPFEPKVAAVEAAHTSVPASADIEPSRQSEAIAASEPEPIAAAGDRVAVREEHPTDLDFVSGPLPYVAASVEATVPPPELAPELAPEIAPVPGPVPEPVSVLSTVTPETVIPDLEPAAIENVVPELEPHPIEDMQSHLVAVTEATALPVGSAQNALGPVAQSMQMTLPPAAQRTMEDTVADLLRPMLKSWLAENMPKIVERALRRELTEQLHSEHKAAAE